MCHAKAKQRKQCKPRTAPHSHPPPEEKRTEQACRVVSISVSLSLSLSLRPSNVYTSIGTVARFVSMEILLDSLDIIDYRSYRIKHRIV